MEKIVTITLNPSIDKSTAVKHLEPEKKLTCATPKFEPGGGGVNVSRALKKMGGKSSAIYFSGGYSGKFFEELLNEEGIDSVTIPIAGSTRENMIVVDETSNLQYRFGMPGPAISTHELEKLYAVFDNAMHVDYLVVSGSLPTGVTEDFFKQLSEISKKIEAKLIVDTSGQALRMAISQGVYMIKPNLGELSMLNGVDELHDNDIVPAARAIIHNGGAKVISVSMGAAGAMLVTADEVFCTASPTVKKKSTVGAGDTMVAGMVLAMLKKWSWKEVLNFGIAAGTATTMNSGTELCKNEDVEKLYAYLREKN